MSEQTTSPETTAPTPAPTAPTPAPTNPKAFTYENLLITKVAEEGDLSFTHRFHAKYTNPDTGAEYTGEFTCHRLTQGDLLKVGSLKMAQTSGILLDDSYDDLSTRIAYLQVALTGPNIKLPDWWDPLASYDGDLIRAMHDYVRAWELSFRSRALEKQRRKATP